MISQTTELQSKQRHPLASFLRLYFLSLSKRLNIGLGVGFKPLRYTKKTLQCHNFTSARSWTYKREQFPVVESSAFELVKRICDCLKYQQILDTCLYSLKTMFFVLNALIAMSVGAPEFLAAQQSTDMVLFNGKVVTVDDKSFTPNIGTIAQAMHVKDGKIVAIGSNAQIRAQAAPSTKQLDLKGRTVLPGMVLVHDHPFEWAAVNLSVLNKVLSDDLVVVRSLKGTPEQMFKEYPAVLQEAVSKAKPGEWIWIVLSLGDKYEYKLGAKNSSGDAPLPGLSGNVQADAKIIALPLMDQLAPNNPVVTRDTFATEVVNSKALEEIEKVFPHKDMLDYINRQTGADGDGNPMGGMRWVFPDVIMRDHYKELREIHRLELSWWSGYGMTGFDSRAYSPANLKIYSDLSKTGDMAVRNQWTWGWRDTFIDGDPYIFNTIVALEGTGNDYFWNGGGWGVENPGSGCTTLQPRIQLPPGANKCTFDPSGRDFKLLYEFVKAGGRISAMHMGGDEDVDFLMEAIERGSRDAGMTIEQIRAKRHTFDHLSLSPRPDQLKRLKDLGMAVGGAPFFYMEMAPTIFKTYGEAAMEWMMPKKSLMDAQIPNGFEIDRPLPTTSLTIFWTLARMIDRKQPIDGKVYGPNQKIGREQALKAATYWGAYYVKKEEKMGSLEPGKLADFIVLDRDYLTIPENDIENIRVLGTVLGGKITHLVPSLAREWGMQPAGAQVELGGAASKW